MKNSLRLGKAIFATLFLIMSFAHANLLAQIATLQHGESFNAFYGIDAFVEAHEAAVDGDVITLSSGDFNAADITKAITLHGAGVQAETSAQCLPTNIKGSMDINIQNETIPLVIEGINMVDPPYGMNVSSILHHASFTKCNIYILHAQQGLDDVQFVNCKIAQFRVKSIDNNLRLINSVIGDCGTYENSTNIIAYNSIFPDIYNNSNFYLYNCIVIHTSFYGPGCFNNSYFYNCIALRMSIANLATAYNCMDASSFSDVFETYTGSGSIFDMDFSLTEEIISSFPGSDGSQVGIFGGAMPYNPRPSYLILNNTTVAGQSDVNGNLNVNVEIIEENK